MGPRAGIQREEMHQIGMLTPEMLAMITQAVQVVVQPVVQTAIQTAMVGVREAETARPAKIMRAEAEQARMEAEARIA